MRNNTVLAGLVGAEGDAGNDVSHGRLPGGKHPRGVHRVMDTLLKKRPSKGEGLDLLAVGVVLSEPFSGCQVLGRVPRLCSCTFCKSENDSKNNARLRARAIKKQNSHILLFWFTSKLECGTVVLRWAKFGLWLRSMLCSQNFCFPQTLVSES